MATRAFIAHAKCDPDDRLVAADEPLASLQIACGGSLPGTIAVPMLLELVRAARKAVKPIGRQIEALGDEERVSAWVEVDPSDPSGDCQIGVVTWRTESAPDEDLRAGSRLHDQINRHCAELSVRLDQNQAVLAASAIGPHLAELAERMNHSRGRVWTEFVAIEGQDHRQPLHWRLLDGAKLRVAGNDRDWKATLTPVDGPEPGLAGFELLLVADQPPPEQSRRSGRPEDELALGRDIAPVLRRPINRIIANAETIKGRLAGPISDEYSGYAADIAAAGQHLLSLIDDLADLEVVEAEDFAVAPDDIDLADVARRAIGILGVRAREKTIELSGPATDDELLATGEFRRALQILLNLVGNAINYSGEGGVVSLAFGRDGGMAQVHIADSGPGLEAEQQSRVFDKFERLGRSGDGGSGLGLYISRKLARAMGGDVTVESVPGEGAIFTLSLPARD